LVVAVTAVAFNRNVKIVPQVHAEQTEACVDQT
jgi:hypothetical protein